MTFSVVCVTRDFEYINDWIEHYLSLNFDRITIYDNKSINPVIYDHPKVIIKSYDGFYGAGYVPYNEHARQYENEKGWTFYCDEDEFLVGKNITTIQEMMKPFENWDAVALNWRIFGDKIDEGNTATNIKEKFLYHVPEEWQNPHTFVKTIVKNDAIDRFVDPHAPILKKGRVNKTVNGEVVKGSISKGKDVSSSMWVDHYHMRSLEDYQTRQTRAIAGRATRKIEEVTNMYNACNELCTKKRID